MNSINFISGGMLGDFIHSLAVVKNMCERENRKARIHLTDRIFAYNGDVWKFGAEVACKDLMDLVVAQPFVEKFSILPEDFHEPFVNLSSWRTAIERDRISNGRYSRSWTEFLSAHYGYEIKKPYKWLEAPAIDMEMDGRVAIHRSIHRHNPNFKWESILDADERFVFVTTSMHEWEKFQFKNGKTTLKLVNSIGEMASSIASCKYFVGNQSAPFALACALDVPRLVELDSSAHAFYMNEKKYSKNMSWYFRDDANTLERFHAALESINNKSELKS